MLVFRKELCVESNLEKYMLHYKTCNMKCFRNMRDVGN